eukprot:scaffold33704_cov27-Tisochrysis_lutea.AAC.1
MQRRTLAGGGVEPLKLCGMFARERIDHLLRLLLGLLTRGADVTMHSCTQPCDLLLAPHALLTHGRLNILLARGLERVASPSERAVSALAALHSRSSLPSCSWARARRSCVAASARASEAERSASACTCRRSCSYRVRGGESSAAGVGLGGGEAAAVGGSLISGPFWAERPFTAGVGANHITMTATEREREREKTPATLNRDVVDVNYRIFTSLPRNTCFSSRARRRPTRPL